MIPIIVTTCDKYRHLLPEFAKRFNKYWKDGREVTVVGYTPPQKELPSNFRFHSLGIEGDGKWTGQMIDFLEDFIHPFFIRLSEEFFIYHPVNLPLLMKVQKKLELDPNIYRIGLQTVHEGYDDQSSFMGSDIFQLNYNAEYLSSFEASIYNTKKLKEYLIPGLHIWDAENNISNKARQNKERVLVTEERIIFYKDAMRRGESRHPEFKNIV